HVAADLERAFIGRGNAALRHVSEKELHAIEQALAIRLMSELHRFWIGREEIGGAHRIDELTDVVTQLALRPIVQRRAFHGTQKEIRIRKIAALDSLRPWIALP